MDNPTFKHKYSETYDDCKAAIAGIINAEPTAFAAPFCESVDKKFHFGAIIRVLEADLETCLNDGQDKVLEEHAYNDPFYLMRFRLFHSAIRHHYQLASVLPVHDATSQFSILTRAILQLLAHYDEKLSAEYLVHFGFTFVTIRYILKTKFNLKCNPF